MDYTIQRIGISRKQPGVRIVHIEGMAPLRVPQRLVDAFGLSAGGSLNEARLKELQAELEKKACRARALRLLSVRARSEEELRRRLVRADFSYLAIHATLETLIEEGYVDDGAFARQFAEERRTGKRQAPARIEHELRARGVEREIAHRAAWDTYERADQDASARLLDQAVALLEKREGRYRDLDAFTVRRRMAGVLARAGYPAGVAIDAVEAVIESMERRGMLRAAPEDET